MFFTQIESSKSENQSDDDGAVVSLESDDSDSEQDDILILIDPSDEDNREYISQARSDNQKKNELWKVLTEDANALGVCMGSETEVKYQYRNMCRGAKEKLLNNRKKMSKTGGGPPPTQLTIAE
ncbi:Hypothetical predicted protein [Mytilus galloprovincialis]|uniref:Myb/SANT-like DNA-binding domain-containing protein n=1 Tax=Mytilus galloprovincialis TaxID=29158 RepID=A0A8B6FPK7_MYTGA|nr:Hypothetical predicted protein [Mytilus galloprovincialis]